MNQEERRIIGLASLGGMLELYDFAIYGTFAIYFSSQLFPAGNPYVTLLQAYSIFLVGFLLRPIGGIIFSHIGDESGRKKVLISTILIMGLSSFGIAVIPTYQAIGVFAPILLIILRLIQGLAMGGELPTALVYVSETIPDKQIFAVSFIMAGVFLGYLLAALINFILTKTFSTAALNAYAWRIPFAFGGLICLISYRIRKALRETAAFVQIINKPKLPLIHLLQNHKAQIVAGTFFSAVQHVFSIIVIIYMPSYLHAILHLDSNYIGNLLPCGLLITVFITLFLGAVYKKQQNIYKIALVSLCLNLLLLPAAYLFMHLQLVALSYISLMCLHGTVGFLMPLLVTLLFPANVRLSGVAICYNLSAAIIGGTAPLVLAAIIKQTGWVYFMPVAYIWLFLLISIIFIKYMRRYL